MLKIVYRVPEELKTYIERCNFVLKSRTNTLKFILTNPSIEISEDKFNKYCDSYMEAYITMECVNKELEESLVPSALYHRETIWAIDRLTGTIAIYYLKNDLDEMIDQFEFKDPDSLIYKTIIDSFDPMSKNERVW